MYTTLRQLKAAIEAIEASEPTKMDEPLYIYNTSDSTLQVVEGIDTCIAGRVDINTHNH